METSNEYITKQEVLDMLQISPQTLKTWRMKGRIPAIRLSAKKFIYRKKDIEAVLRRSQIKADSRLDFILREIAYMDKEERDQLKAEIKRIEVAERIAKGDSDA